MNDDEKKAKEQFNELADAMPAGGDRRCP